MIVDAWPAASGEFIAQKTEALFVERGTLFVRVEDSVWAQHLSLQKNSLINKLNRNVRTRLLKDIRFQLGSTQNRQESVEKQEQRDWREIKLGEKELAVVEKSLLELSSWPELQTPVRKMFLSHRKWINWLFQRGYKACIQCGMPVYPGHKTKLCSFCRK